MQVFKAYFSVLKRQGLFMILLYLAVLMLITFMQSSSADNSMIGYEAQKPNITLIDEDNSVLSQHLINYLGEYATIKDYLTEEELRDALFYNDISLIVTIPKGFEEDFQEENFPQISTTNKPGSFNSLLFTQYIDRYLNLAALSQSLHGFIHFEWLEEILATEAPVEMITDHATEYQTLYQYMKICAYAMIAANLFSVPMTLSAFQSRQVKRRTMSSPMKLTQYNLALFSGNLIINLVIFIAIMAMGLLSFGTILFSEMGIYYMLIAFAFNCCCLSLSYMISNIIQKREIISPIANVCSLGFSFLGGVFVPLSLLPESTKIVSAFIPTYWYTKGLESIHTIQVRNQQTLTEYRQCMIMILFFFLAFTCISLLASKQTPR